MKKQTFFSGPAEYDQKRPYCVVTSGPPVSYDINSRWATRQAANNACERASMQATVMTITAVNKANAAACNTESARLLAVFANEFIFVCLSSASEYNAPAFRSRKGAQQYKDELIPESGIEIMTRKQLAQYIASAQQCVTQDEQNAYLDKILNR